MDKEMEHEMEAEVCSGFGSYNTPNPILVICLGMFDYHGQPHYWPY